MGERIGFYICHCGINISYRVRVKEVAEYVATLPNVCISRDYLFMCSDPGQELIETDIQEYNLTRVVVASCSPRMHEKTFRAACQRGGLNPYRAFHMVSVREQVSWVTEDEDLATQKAKILACAGVIRVSRQKDLFPATFPVCTNTLVVGGGIAGMQASLDIAKSGFKAYLVEREPTIGGHMLQYDKTFPTLDCAACIGTPKMVSVAQEPNINLMSNSEIVDISGFIGNFKVTVRKKARYVETNCTGCGECEKVCPISTPNEWDVGTKLRKAIYRPFPQAVPITYCIDKYDRAPCVQTCPAGTNVQGYVALIKMGKYPEAIKLIMEKIPLPGTLGRVCPAPCETACRRADVDTPLAIRNLKRFVADQVAFESLPIPDIQDKPEKIAVVGSGPAGLTAAYYLRRKGYQVTIFEALDHLGGMLRVGIPDYRLPIQILDNEINYLLAHGIQVKTGVRFGPDLTLKSLEKEGFSAVFLGIGAHESIQMPIPGQENVQGIIDAVTLLRQINLGSRRLPGNKVVVIGGGNVAIDAARSVKRLGAETVTLVYRRSEQEMPAYEDEITGAIEENINILYLTAPINVKSQGGRLTGLECIKNELGPADESGRRRPVPIKGSEFILPCDTMIPAIGQKIDVSWSGGEPGLALTNQNRFKVNPDTLQTSLAHVFAAGDAVTGPATVVEAVAAGHKAVAAIDRFIQGESLETNEKQHKDAADVGDDWKPMPENLEKVARVVSNHLDPITRAACFDEVDLNFTEDEARKEASRCLDCGGCCECKLCVDACEAKAVNHDMIDTFETIDVGSIIVATGFDALDPTPMTQYGYGKFANVFTNLEFERLSNAT
ncbi:MAG: FAD-dependent oxidoreductase, partial [Pseudomonadota bacterium]